MSGLTLLIGTHNRGKIGEISRVLEPLGINCVSSSDLNIELSEPEETGTTFAENARIKAVSAMKESGFPSVSDDSGLEIDALNGRPGVYTARYGGKEDFLRLGEDFRKKFLYEHPDYSDVVNFSHSVPFSEKIEILLEEMKNVPEEKRTARFRCAICCALPDGRLIEAEGKVEGKIGYEPNGDNGFGFDPVFYRDGRSFAEYSAEEKDACSHRGEALRLFAEKMKEI